jgi:hypothetical protein
VSVAPPAASAPDEDRASRSHLRRQSLSRFERKGRRSASRLGRNARAHGHLGGYSVACSRWITLTASWFKYRPVRATMNLAFYLRRSFWRGLGYRVQARASDSARRSSTARPQRQRPARAATRPLSWKGSTLACRSSGGRGVCALVGHRPPASSTLFELIESAIDGVPVRRAIVSVFAAARADCSKPVGSLHGGFRACSDAR